MWRCLCVLMSPEANRIVEFAKRVPGFKTLGQSEQVVLIKAHFFKAWLLRITCMFLSASELRDPPIQSNSMSKFTNNTDQVFLTFESGHCISREQLELVYDVKTIFSMVTLNTELIKIIVIFFLYVKKNFMDKVFQLAKFLDELKLNDIEIGIICGLLFTSVNGNKA